MSAAAPHVCEAEETELEYMRSQRRLETALGGARGGMWDWDLANGGARHAEPYYRILGVTPRPGDHSWAFWNERVHPEDAARVESELQDVVAGRRAVPNRPYGSPKQC